MSVSSSALLPPLGAAPSVPVVAAAAVPAAAPSVAPLLRPAPGRLRALMSLLRVWVTSGCVCSGSCCAPKIVVALAPVAAVQPFEPRNSEARLLFCPILFRLSVASRHPSSRLFTPSLLIICGIGFICLPSSCIRSRRFAIVSFCFHRLRMLLIFSPPSIFAIFAIMHRLSNGSGCATYTTDAKSKVPSVMVPPAERGAGAAP